MTARLPSLNGLRAFEAAARHLSFTQAASELNVTQTAISHQIKRLEEELGVRLFIRQNRSLALTQQAEEYLPGIRDHVLLHTSNANSDDWRLWLTVAGLPADFSKQPGVTFDMIFMTVQAAIDGLGVAMGRTAYVQEDIARGRLVVPFNIAFPVDAGFYLV